MYTLTLTTRKCGTGKATLASTCRLPRRRPAGLDPEAGETTGRTSP